MTISIEYEAEKKLELPWEEIIRETVLASLDYEQCPYEAEVNVILTDDEASGRSTGSTGTSTLPQMCSPFLWWIMNPPRILTMWRRRWRITSTLRQGS